MITEKNNKTPLAEDLVKSLIDQVTFLKVNARFS